MSTEPDNRRIDGAKLTRWYNAQARFYSARRDAFDGAHVRAVADRLDSSKALRILDAGCGTGLFTIGLAGMSSSWSVEGVDAAEGMLAVAREHARQRSLANASFRIGDVERLDSDDTNMDVVVAAGLFANLNTAEPALAEFHRILGTGGRLFIVEIDRDSMSFFDQMSFRVMVLGYRAISTLMPRFKFARGWSLERSTLDPTDLATSLRTAGFASQPAARVHGHFILEAVKR